MPGSQHLKMHARASAVSFLGVSNEFISEYLITSFVTLINIYSAFHFK